MSRERIHELSIVRAFAFFAIVLQHCIAEYIYRDDILPPDEIMLAMLFHFTRFGTPAFVFLSGVILFYNYRSNMNYFTYLKKRSSDILVPFICWTLIYWVSVSSFISVSPFTQVSTWRELLRQFYQPTYGYHLWFILMIFQFYILLPLFIRIGNAVKPLITRAGERSALRRTLLLIGAAGGLYVFLLWFSYYIAPEAAAHSEGAWKFLITHRGQLFVSYFFYFLVGAVCAYGLAKWRELSVSTLAAGIIAFVVMYVWAGYELLTLSTETMKLGYSSYLRPTIFFLIVVQLWAVYGIALLVEKHGGSLRRFLLFIGRHSFGGFLAHAYVLMLISLITRPLKLSGYHLPVTVLTFAATAAGSIGLAKLLSLLPFGWLLAGAPGRSRSKQKAAGRSDHRATASVKM